jgi:hypothetical protein
VDLRVAGYFFAAHLGHELRLLPAVEQLRADTQLPGRGLRTAALAGQAKASVLNASSYLRRLSGDAPLVLVAMTEEIYVLLLSVMPRPRQ